MAIRTGRALYEGRHPHVRGYRGTHMFVIDPLFNGLVPGLGFVWGAYLVRAGKRSQVGRPSG